jgi:hypothetical protein
MSALDIKLDWYRDSAGYCLNDYGKYGATVVGKGGKLVPTRPLEKNDVVFKTFADVDTQKKLLEFVHHYGLLLLPAYGTRVSTRGGETTAFEKTAFRYDHGKLTAVVERPGILGEDVNEHLETANNFRNLMSWMSRGGKAPKPLAEWIESTLLGEQLADLSLDFDTRRGFRAVLKTDSLMNGMLIQLTQKLSGGLKFQECKLCAKLFEVGPQADRRADAQFCSDAHRVTHNSGQRLKARSGKTV